MRARRWIGIALVLAPLAVIGLLGERAASAPGEGGAAPPGGARIELAHDVAMLATGAPATAQDLGALAAGGFTPGAYARYIEELLRRPAAVSVAASVLRIIGSPSRALWAETVLKQREVDGKTVYYIHEPCDAARAEAVRPWWALDTTVLVCPEAHRPAVFRAPDGNYCSGVYAAAYQPGSPCGCGPNLIRCMRSEQDKEAFSKAIVAEASGTVGWIVRHDLALQALFSSPESFRPPLAELLYQRWLVENRDAPSLESLPDWRAWPKEGKWAPRPASRPDQHAGILTNHFVPQNTDSQRLKVSGFFDMLWCEGADSQRVETHALLETAEEFGANLRSKVGWEALAARPVCTSCHARIDYGVQFFTGMEWYFRGLHYMAPLQQDTVGPLYRTGIDDERGRAKRNPQGFIQLAMAQPEFPRCMARNFLVHAFAGASDPALQPLDEALQSIVRRRGSYRELMTTTLAHYVERALAAPGPRAPRTAAPRTPAERAAAVAALVDEQCGSCHEPRDGHAPGRILEHGAAWCARAGADCARLGVEVLSSIAFERMPKERPLPLAERRRWFEQIAPIAWPDPAQQAAARRYFIDAPQAPPVHRIDAMLSWVRTSGAAPGASAPPAGAGSGAGSGSGGAPAAAPAPAAFPPVSAGPGFSATTAAQLGIAAATACAAQPDPAACLQRAMDRRGLEK